jgi:formylglycine-generating enzyme required for sulfatase activity
LLGQNDPWVKWCQIGYLLSDLPSFHSTKLGSDLYAALPERLANLGIANIQSPTFCHRQCNGSDAVELAILAAAKAYPEKHLLIALKGSYHGQNWTAFSTSDLQQSNRFLEKTGNVIFADAPSNAFQTGGTGILSDSESRSLQQIEANLRPAFGILVEPIQMNNGVLAGKRQSHPAIGRKDGHMVNTGVMIAAFLFAVALPSFGMSAATLAATQAGDMIVIPAGHFTMGSDAAETAHNEAMKELAQHEQPRHEVTVASFLLAKFDVTRGEYAEFVVQTGYASAGCNIWNGLKWSAVSTASWKNPGFEQTDRDPVVCVNAADIDAYIHWYSAKTGKAYRLPSEAEWEYAARAGSTSTRFWGDDLAQQCTYANGSAQSYSKAFPQEPDVNHLCSDGYVYTSPVGTYQPNPWGLYDMVGDAWQWTADCWNKSYAGAPADGTAWKTGNCAVRPYRGGSWYDGPWQLRSSMRNSDKIDGRYNGVGFRLASSIDATATPRPADSLLDADRALATQSHAIGFVAAYSKAMAPDARKLDAGAPKLIGAAAILVLAALEAAILPAPSNSSIGKTSAATMAPSRSTIPAKINTTKTRITSSYRVARSTSRATAWDGAAAGSKARFEPANIGLKRLRRDRV